MIFKLLFQGKITFTLQQITITKQLHCFNVLNL